MAGTGKYWIGADPGGIGKFGLAVLYPDGDSQTFVLDHADATINIIREHVPVTPGGVGVDAPLWWSSGAKGTREADRRIRSRHGLFSRNVLDINSMRGSVLVQGMMFVARIRELFPGVNVTETHPKALIKALGNEHWENYFAALGNRIKLDSHPDDERDAIISAIAAREGFTARWKHDLSTARASSEQDPSAYWLAPVHYFWPEPC